MTLSPPEILRYGRQMVMPEFGREGQERLKASRVLIVGVGGLGSPAATYLAAAGVGHLGLIDFDRVEATNLHRQILYREADLGRPKVEVAMERLTEVNPHIEVTPIAERLEPGNAIDLIAEYDVVIDGSDNFPTRYLVNDACVLAGRPDVFGTVLRFEGQVSVFATQDGPCYRCLHPQAPAPGTVPTCAEGGVLGVLPGIIGSLQAHEAIKLLLGLGEPLVGRLLVFDGLGLEFREMTLPKRPGCLVCSPDAGRELGDYDAACESREEVPVGTEEPGRTQEPGSAEKPGGIEEPVPFDISAVEVEAWRQEGRSFLLLDVRMPREFDVARVEDTTLLPLHELPTRLEELPRDRDMVVMCHHGIRSTQAVNFLRHHGFDRVRNLAGGIQAWSREVDPAVPEY